MQLKKAASLSVTNKADATIDAKMGKDATMFLKIKRVLSGNGLVVREYQRARQVLAIVFDTSSVTANLPPA